MQVETMRDKDEQTERAPHLRPVRTCVGCSKADDAESLVRVVLGPPDAKGAPVAVDMAGGKHGRGAHVHARTECLDRAAKSGLSRSFKTKVTVTADELAQQIADGADRRIAGLLAGAWRGRLLGIGADAAIAALDKGAPCLVVAGDAGSLIERGAFARAPSRREERSPGRTRERSARSLGGGKRLRCAR